MLGRSARERPSRKRRARFIAARSTTTRSISGCCRGIVPTRSTRAAFTSRTTVATRPGGRGECSVNSSRARRRIVTVERDAPRLDRTLHAGDELQIRSLPRARGRTPAGSTSVRPRDRCAGRGPTSSRSRVGVTGPPSLGKFTQTLAHSVAPTFNRPTDWTGQIGFEPGVIVRYEQRRRLGLDDHAIGFDVIPRMSVTAGNVSTNAEVGVQTRTGWHLRHPWLPRDGPLRSRSPAESRLVRSRAISFSTATRSVTDHTSATRRSWGQERSAFRCAFAR